LPVTAFSLCCIGLCSLNCLARCGNDVHANANSAVPRSVWVVRQALQDEPTQKLCCKVEQVNTHVMSLLEALQAQEIISASYTLKIEPGTGASPAAACQPQGSLLE
jgi:ribosomal protein L10